MRVVLDVGIFVSAIIRADGHPSQILETWRDGRFDVLSSLPILDDLRRVLAYPRIRKHHRLTAGEIDQLVIALGDAVRLAPDVQALQVVPGDPDDDKIIACAVAGDADYIVSGDEHLLSMVHYEGIQIVSPRRFLAILG
ncbi:MAG: putative toxin-antitoxin system toxin component, PIN family [Chloroflexi bacterium]|nr:putative toxin-antitoxin system toxin component, PIN family [Chloroflexota bacterium]